MQAISPERRVSVVYHLGVSEREWHVAQYNIARLVAPLDSAQLADFVAALDPINQLGDRCPDSSGGTRPKTETRLRSACAATR